MWKGNLAKGKLKNSATQRIVCDNLLYNKKSYIFNIIFSLIILYCFYKLFHYSIALNIAVAKVLYGLLIVMQLLELFMYGIALFNDRYAYLTADGVIACIGILTPKDCSFSWELHDTGEMPDVLLVYKKGMKVPYRFRIIDNRERAHEMVHAFSFRNSF